MVFSQNYAENNGIVFVVKIGMDSGLDSEKCVRIAFVEGFTTSARKDVNRGLGLIRLEKFIELNNGSMHMYTDNIFYSIDGKEKEKKFKKLQKPITGTLVIITIAADEHRIYIVEKEKKS